LALENLLQSSAGAGQDAMADAMACSDVKMLGSSFEIDCESDDDFFEYYVYACIPIYPGDLTDLGEIEIAFSTYPVGSSAKMAAVRICSARGSPAWAMKVKEQLAQWLGPEKGPSRCCCRPSQVRHFKGLHRAPPSRWSVMSCGGAVWNEFVERAGKADETGQTKLLESRCSDPLVAYQSMLSKRGYHVPTRPPSGLLERTCYAKFLHTFECEQVRHVQQTILRASGVQEYLDFSRDWTPPAEQDERCTIS